LPEAADGIFSSDRDSIEKIRQECPCGALRATAFHQVQIP
jgi:hypothetical protein